jgi:hypothetical protein
MNKFDSTSLIAVEPASATSQAGLRKGAPLAGTITSLESLREHLQWAVELEHSTIPPYLCALYSIEPGRNVEATEVVSSVLVEEMLHLTLAANLLDAVGGRPRLAIPKMMPGYPRPLPNRSNVQPESSGPSTNENANRRRTCDCGAQTFEYVAPDRRASRP